VYSKVVFFLSKENKTKYLNTKAKLKQQQQQQQQQEQQ